MNRKSPVLLIFTLALITLAGLLIFFIPRLPREETPSDAGAGISTGEDADKWILRDHLTAIYEQAVRDFADMESTRAGFMESGVIYRLDRLYDSVDVWGDGPGTMLNLDPEHFRGVDFKTPLGERLLNADATVSDEVRERALTLFVNELWFSEAGRRVQITIMWSRTIGESWTFLYRIDPDGKLVLLKSVVYGCTGPSGWIDGS